MTLKNKKILITGGSGFIGHHLAKKIKTLGGLVENYNLSDGNDIEDSKNLETFIKKKFDVIYHLAGFSGNEQGNQDKKKCVRLNTFAAAGLFELVSRFSPKSKVILSGSRLEYGIPKYLPVDENHPTIPTSIYGLSKLSAAQTAMIYHHQNNIDVTIFRTSNVYGPHEEKNFLGYNLVNHFLDLAKDDKELIIFGKGDQKRDYLYIDDLVEAFILASVKKSAGQIYNLGFGEEITVKKMAQLIIKVVQKGKIVTREWPSEWKEVETGSYVTDISKIKKELLFIPKVGFEEGITKVFKKL